MTLHDKYMKEKLYEQQGGRCNAPCEDYELERGIPLPIRLFENDHVDPEGGDEIENRQLLCSHCNRVKGKRPMASLIEHHRMRWEIEQAKRNQITLIPQERIARRRQPVVDRVIRKQKLPPQYMSVACMTGVLFAASRHLGI